MTTIWRKGICVFLEQIKRKLKENPDLWIITYRGYAHYNIDERLALEGYEVYTAFAEPEHAQLVLEDEMVCYKNKIGLSEEEERVLVLKSMIISEFLSSVNCPANMASKVEVILRDVLARFSYEEIKDLTEKIEGYRTSDFFNWVEGLYRDGFLDKEGYMLLRDLW